MKNPENYNSNEMQPNYLGLYDIKKLENVAHEGLDTYRGHRSFDFRIGIELEFKLGLPSEFAEVVTNNDQLPDSTKHWKTEEVLNKGILGNQDTDNDTAIDEFKVYARSYIQKLPTETDDEIATRNMWLGQIDEFGLSEFINFSIYEEFSKPRLTVPQIGSSITVGELDEYSDENGWVEWRFGNGTLQSGYYDNPGVSELRMTPCEPSEALRRLAVIKERMAEIGTELGVLVMTSAACEHVNMSIYENKDNSSQSERSIIGNSESTQQDTVDITSGIAEALQDGIGIDPKTVEGYDFMFGPYATRCMAFGPTRKTVRVLDGRIELRGGFGSTEQAVAWVMAGAIDGLQRGSDDLKEEGYEVTSVQEVLKVNRTNLFNKERDLQIQRAIEKSTIGEDGRLVPDGGWLMTRGDDFVKSVTDTIEDNKPKPDDRLAELIIAACTVEDGSVSISEENIRLAIEENLARHFHLRDEVAAQIEEYGLPMMISKINERLKVIQVQRAPAVVGDIRRSPGLDREATFEQIRNSRVVKLAMGANIDKHIELLTEASRVFDRSRQM